MKPRIWEAKVKTLWGDNGLQLNFESSELDTVINSFIHPFIHLLSETVKMNGNFLWNDELWG
jgi:hypothetical protein